MIFFNAILYFYIIYYLDISSTCSTESYDLKLVEEYVYVPFENCNYTLKNPKVVINPYKKEIKNAVQSKPFASFFLKCAACISVAKEIAKTLEAVILDLNQNPSLDIQEEVASKLSLLCSNGFKKKYNKDVLVTNKLLCTEHVRSNMDGSWTKKLREICYLYTSYMDLTDISHDTVFEREELPDKLCRSTGIFRDCINVDQEKLTNVVGEINLCDQCNCQK